ncbi:MAG: hypothetical protein MI749_15335, partial [Desulfovibrionales bacterium]|nr:hypothetical protein [Desulfovibrionales bacterium]
MDTINNAVVVRTTNGANLTLRDSAGDTGGDATVNLTSLAGTSTSGVGNTSLAFDGSGDIETFNSDTLHTDTIGFTMPGTITTSVAGTSSVVLENTATSAGANTAAVLTSTLTVLMEPGMSMSSDIASAQGLFGSGGTAVTGGSIMTFGGEDGFENFSAGDVISFDLDGQTISFTVNSAAGGTTEAGLAQQLFDELNSDITDEGYTVIRNGKSVSVIKAADSDDPIRISNFSDTGGSDARLQISTGTGEGVHEPENNVLDASKDSRNFAVSSLYDDTGQILWERLDMDGNSTGSSGLVKVDADGEVVINEGGVQTVSFDIGRGALVAGNTLLLNTDEDGRPDPLQMKVFRQANSVNDTYHFKVISGGKIGHPSEDEQPLVVEWSSDVAQGRFEIPPNDPPKDPNVPVEVKVDGMLLVFSQGSLVEGERFTITTDESGLAVSKDSQGHGTAETQTDWHWTQDSFADRLNRIAPGVQARVNHENRMVFEASDYYSVENV